MQDPEPKTLRVKTDTDEFVLHGNPCELSAFSHVPTNRNLPKERTYFNVEKKERYSYSVFDRQFLKDFGYDQKLHRCDREHFKARGLEVNEEHYLKYDDTDFSLEVAPVIRVIARKAKGPLIVAHHEMGKDVPSLPKSTYGKRLSKAYDPPGRQYARINYIDTDFYRRNGTNLKDEGVKVLSR